MDEAHPVCAQSPYAASKIGADAMAQAYHRSFKLPVVTVRPFNTYGPRQSARAVIPTIITQALKGDVIKLGSLAPRRDFTFAGDTVRGFMMAADSNNLIGEEVNLGSGEAVSIGDLVRMISAQIGRQPSIVIDPQRIRPEGSEVMELVASSDKAARLIDWHPLIGLADGLALTIRGSANISIATVPMTMQSDGQVAMRAIREVRDGSNRGY